jgi:ketosteroid isomerase-like protein
MYKASVRWMIKRNIAKLNTGDYGPALAMYTDDATLTFPGDNSWATMFGPHERGRAAVPTHRGRAEIEAFLRRYTEHGIQMVVDDILVNGPPWRARAAVRCHDWIPGDHGGDVYDNRAVMWVQTRWGRIVEHEDYEDTQRTTAYDDHLARQVASSTAAT